MAASHYPDCDFISWDEPMQEKCPKCGKTLFEKEGEKAQRSTASRKDAAMNRVARPG